MSNPPFYNTNTPTPELSFADWQRDFLKNFQSLGATFSVDHVSLTESSNVGNHTVIHLLEQTNSPQTGLTEISVYSKDVEGQTDQTFIRYPGNGEEFQYTNYQIYSIEPTDTQISYFTFLPGGILVYFGQLTAKGSIQRLLLLQPSICKNVVSVNFTPINVASLSNFPSTSTIIKNGDFITGVELGFAGPQVDQYYVVMGNL